MVDLPCLCVLPFPDIIMALGVVFVLFQGRNCTYLISTCCSTCALTKTQLEEEWDFIYFFLNFSLQNLLV